jgi:hypothetical protein
MITVRESTQCTIHYGKQHAFSFRSVFTIPFCQWLRKADVPYPLGCRNVTVPLLLLVEVTLRLNYLLLVVEAKVTLRLTVNQSVLVSSTLVGLATRYYFLLECCYLKFAVLFPWGALSDERTDLQFTVQSLNGPSRSEPVTILCCLI